jgi:putative spermidine/putrescine transport system ATP-binding protein
MNAHALKTEISNGVTRVTNGRVRQGQPVVAVQQLTKIYDTFTAVDSMSLDVDQGELLCLLGPSGCGKTTTLSMIAGFVQPTLGAIRIAGADVTRLPPYKRDTGMVFQSYALFPHMTVAANVAFGLENLGVSKVERKRRVGEMLDLVELSHLANRFPRELSGGQQQRVALARALAIRPAVLLLDEPFSNLDAQLRVRLREEMRRLIDAVDITTLFVTHDQDEALVLSDRIVVMNKGRIEQIGTPREIYEEPASRFVAEFIGSCSVLEGTLRDGEFRTPGGISVPLPAAGNIDKALLVVRPEQVRLAGPSGTLAFDARVENSSYYGGMTRVRLNAGGESLLMEAHFAGVDVPKPGDDIRVQINPVCVRLIAAP